MPIEISCDNCSKRLRVPDTAAGKRVKCPGCQTVLSVPAGGGGGSSAGATAGGAKYHLKTEDGQTFGPVPKKELDDWLKEGRITAECQILKDGGEQWQWATDLYPQLDEGASGAGGAAGSSAGGFPGIDTGGSGGASDNPFAFAADDTSPTARVTGGKKKTPSTSNYTPTSSAGSSAPAADSGELSDKSKMVAGLLELLCPMVGIHGIGRFYLGYTGIGVAQLLTCGGCGWWSLIDGIMILMDKVPDAEGRKLKD